MNCFLVRAADDGPRVQFEQDEFKSMAVTCTWPRSTHMLERHDPDNECGWTHPEWDQPAMVQHAMETHLMSNPPETTGDDIPAGTEEKPHYFAFDTGAGRWAVNVDEGWRQSILCTGMYEWTARWLADRLQGTPFAPGLRPGDKPDPCAAS